MELAVIKVGVSKCFDLGIDKVLQIITNICNIWGKETERQSRAIFTLVRS